MEELVKFLKSHERYILQSIETDYLTQEVKDTLSKYNLTLHELCYRIKKNIPLDKVFTCKYCGKPIKFNYRGGYRQFCCYKCSSTFTNSSEEIKNKKKQTYLKHYGVDNISKLDSMQQFKKQNYLKKYGVESYTQTQEYKEKSRQTCLKKYGKEYFTQTQNYKDKVKATCLKNYGTDSYFNTSEFKNFLKEHQEEILEKITYSKKQNNSFNVSGQEERVYKLLLTKFNKDDIKRQYKSKLYSFACDFYIKSLDLYIEYNGNWTHGKQSFDKDNLEHQRILEVWKEKAKESKFYRNAIYTWTDLDVRKLETFKRNNLNYKIFWNLKEAEDWLNQII